VISEGTFALNVICGLFTFGISSLEMIKAKGSYKNVALASHREHPYWKHRLNINTFWNSMQYVMDRQHNSILRRRTRNLVTLHLLDDSISNSTQHQLGCQPNYAVMWSFLGFFNLTPEMQRFVLSMHCRDYPLLIEPPTVCANQSAMLLLAIKSQTKNFENRQAIRQTWGHSGLVQGRVGMGGLVQRVFLLAKSAVLEDSKEMMDLEKESKSYGDIIMWDFLDTFFNLTLKDILFWEWFSEHCQNARFVFKGDDDVFVRTPALLDYLQKEEEVHSAPNSLKKIKDFVVGDVIKRANPLRLKSSKYYIPESFYKGMYPAYAGGGGVIYSGALVLRLFQVSKRVHLFPIDDVYVGMCLQRLRIVPVDQSGFLTFDFSQEEAKNPCAYHTILLVHKRSPSEVLKLWSETLIPSAECSHTTLRSKALGKKRQKPEKMAKEKIELSELDQTSIS
uniref:Hexosyltransferase n=1 Tax=Electrophorus electricus TaxID=8005 RepID=A0A4W4FZL0_ELEEL